MSGKKVAFDPLFVNRYLLVPDPLHRGSMSTVYRATDLQRSEAVVIKIVPAERPDLIMRSEREVAAHRRLQHPRILPLLDSGTCDRGHYLVFRYLKLGDVERLVVRRGPLRPRHAASLMIHLLDALGAVHGCGMTHRDVKASNLLLESEEEATLIDFGLVAMYAPHERSRRITSPLVPFGTPGYIAPERCLAGKYGSDPHADLDPRSDLYACGVVLYELLAGQLPFRSPDPVELVRAHIFEDPPPFPEDGPRPRCPELERIALWAMRKLPDSRPASAEVMRAAILAAIPPR